MGALSQLDGKRAWDRCWALVRGLGGHRGCRLAPELPCIGGGRSSLATLGGLRGARPSGDLRGLPPAGLGVRTVVEAAGSASGAA